jgi:hypothetical protein
MYDFCFWMKKKNLTNIQVILNKEYHLDGMPINSISNKNKKKQKYSLFNIDRANQEKINNRIMVKIKKVPVSQIYCNKIPRSNLLQVTKIRTKKIILKKLKNKR